MFPSSLPSHVELVHLIVDVPRTLPQQLTMLKMSGKEHEYINKEDVPDGLQMIRESPGLQGIFKKAGGIILQFWRHGTLKQYSSYITKWISFCGSQQID